MTGWERALHKSGFSGLEVVVQDQSDETSHCSSLMTCTVLGEGRAYSDVTLLTGRSINPTLLGNVMARFESEVTCRHATFIEGDPRGQVCIVLAEVSEPMMLAPSEDDFNALRNIVSHAKGLLWVTRGATAASPASSLITGFARVLRAEGDGRPIITLDLDPTIPIEDESVANAIYDVFVSSLDHTDREQSFEDVEFAQMDSTIQIPRLIRDEELDCFIETELGEAPPAEEPLRIQARPVALRVGVPGLLDTLRLVDIPADIGGPPPDCVRVEIKAAGLNFLDVMTALGEYPNDTLGRECSGVVLAVGPGAEAGRFKVGDRVVGHSSMLNSAIATELTDAAHNFLHLPETMSFEEGAAMPAVFGTGHHSIYEVARLQKGETILIHAASGAMGQALIALSQLVGAEIFATVGTKEKSELLTSVYGIPEDHIFSSRDGTFAKAIMRSTNGKGIDVIVNSLAGELLRLTWTCIAPFGRFVELGKRDFEWNSLLEMKHFGRNVTFAGVDWLNIADSRHKYTQETLKKVLKLMKDGLVKVATPIRTFGLGEVEFAFRMMQQGKHMGKLMLVPREGEMVKVSF